jgi:hypothetical protein
LEISFPERLYFNWKYKYYEVNLSQAPIQNVVITLLSTDTSKLTLETATLTFTNGDFAAKQKVYFNTLSSTASYGAIVKHTVTSADLSYSGNASFTYC